MKPKERKKPHQVFTQEVQNMKAERKAINLQILPGCADGACQVTNASRSFAAFVWQNRWFCTLSTQPKNKSLKAGKPCGRAKRDAFPSKDQKQKRIEAMEESIRYENKLQVEELSL